MKFHEKVNNLAVLEDTTTYVPSNSCLTPQSFEYLSQSCTKLDIVIAPYTVAWFDRCFLLIVRGTLANGP